MANVIIPILGYQVGSRFCSPRKNMSAERLGGIHGGVALVVLEAWQTSLRCWESDGSNVNFQSQVCDFFNGLDEDGGHHWERRKYGAGYQPLPPFSQTLGKDNEDLLPDGFEKEEKKDKRMGNPTAILDLKLQELLSLILDGIQPLKEY
ncbi:hypothetical protein HAX54_033753 [Datura stramonium]|uniref:Uncharacterized protein n=1 Tax=Datura stramonium TaxID=4076 RepID=A0ABS8VDI9_DATST|nr:hypothetical protein [Datura stramonium]